jgi:hypothetical protein
MEMYAPPADPPAPPYPHLLFTLFQRARAHTTLPRTRKCFLSSSMVRK